MRCRVCGHDGMGETEYRTGSVRAPALECRRCHAIQLDERVAKSEQERDSVRRALVARQSAGNPDSGTYRTDAGAISAAVVDSVVSEVGDVLAEVRVAHEFLAQMTDGELGKAVADAQSGIQRVEALMDDLARRCARETRRASGTVDDSGALAIGGGTKQ